MIIILNDLAGMILHFITVKKKKSFIYNKYDIHIFINIEFSFSNKKNIKLFLQQNIFICPCPFFELLFICLNKFESFIVVVVLFCHLFVLLDIRKYTKIVQFIDSTYSDINFHQGGFFNMKKLKLMKTRQSIIFSYNPHDFL